MALSTAEMRFGALFAKIFRLVSARALFAQFQAAWFRSPEATRNGRAAAKMCRKPANGPRPVHPIFINSKPRRGFARRVEIPLSRLAASCPQQNGNGLAGDRTMDVLRSRC
jgi:hypothetical protein